MCIIAIDYDDTITADFVGARKAIIELRKAGHVIVIWSSRNNLAQHGQNRDTLMKDMVETLKNHQVPYNEIDTGDVGKFHAQVYIDDKALRFEGDWDKIIQQIY